MRDQIIKDLNNRVCDIGNGMVLVPIITEEYADLVEMELIPD